MKRLLSRITIDDLKALYETTVSISEIAQKFKVSNRTIRNHLKKAGVQIHRGPRKGSHCFPHHSCLAKWLQDHPQQILPRRISSIALLTGCSINEIKTYIYRRRKELREVAQKLPDLKTTSVVLTDVLGRRIPAKAFQRYKLYLDKVRFQIVLKAELKPRGKATFVFSLIFLRSLFKEEVKK